MEARARRLVSGLRSEERNNILSSSSPPISYIGTSPLLLDITTTIVAPTSLDTISSGHDEIDKEELLRGSRIVNEKIGSDDREDTSVDGDRDEDEDDEELYNRSPYMYFKRKLVSPKIRSNIWSLIVVIGIISLWCSSAILTSDLGSGNPGLVDAPFDNPWLLTWLSDSLGIFLAPLYWLLTKANMTHELQTSNNLTWKRAFLYAIPLNVGFVGQALLYFIALGMV
jgi:hypothetical protein